MLNCHPEKVGIDRIESCCFCVVSTDGHKKGFPYIKGKYLDQAEASNAKYLQKRPSLPMKRDSRLVKKKVIWGYETPRLPKITKKEGLDS